MKKTNLLNLKTDVHPELSMILKDTILLDEQCQVVLVSRNLLDRLEFSTEELVGKHINYQTRDIDLCEVVRGESRLAGSKERYVPFYAKSNTSLLMVVSLIEAGLLSQAQRYTMLRVSEFSHVGGLEQEAETKRAELDHFIYRTAHDLRGPIATIRGLINLHKLRPSEFAADRFAQLIGQYAEQLDQKLCRLLYLAESGQEVVPAAYCLRLRDMEKMLRQTVEHHALGHVVQLHVATFDDQVRDINEVQSLALVENLLLFILHLPPRSAKDNRVVVFISAGEGCLEVRVISRGVQMDDRLISVIQHRKTGYGQMLRHSELIHYFAAQKIALSLNASILLEVPDDHTLEMKVRIPANPVGLDQDRPRHS